MSDADRLVSIIGASISEHRLALAVLQARGRAKSLDAQNERLEHTAAIAALETVLRRFERGAEAADHP
jgi:hypothetical protein